MSDINECIDNSNLCLAAWNNSSSGWNNSSRSLCVNTYGSYYRLPVIEPRPPPTKAITIGASFLFNSYFNFFRFATKVVELFLLFFIFKIRLAIWTYLSCHLHSFSKKKTILLFVLHQATCPIPLLVFFYLLLFNKNLYALY